MGQKPEAIRVSNAIQNDKITLVIIGNMSELKQQKKTIKWDVEGGTRMSKLMTNDLKGHFGHVVESENVDVTRRIYLPSMSTTIFPLADCKHISAALTNTDGDQLLTICENMPTKNIPSGFIWYQYKGHIRMGVLRRNERFKMIPYRSGIFEERNYPPGLFCPQCKEEIRCKPNCSRGP